MKSKDEIKDLLIYELVNDHEKFVNYISAKREVEQERDQLIKELASKNEALQKEQSKLQAVLDSLPVAVFIADKNGKMVKYNDLVNDIWGGNPPLAEGINQYEQYIGWNEAGELIKAEDWALARAISKGETSLGEVIDIFKFDGTKGTILNSASPIRDSQGNVTGGVAVLQDLTHQRQIEKELRQHRERLIEMVAERTEELATTKETINNILESITDCFFAVDKSWKFIYVNKAVCSKLNKQPKELIGNSLWEVLPEPKDSVFYQQYNKVMSEREAVQFEAYSDHCESYCEVRVYPYINGISIYIKDVTEKKKYEKELRRLDGLNLIGQMAASISHEVRNPMTTVRGFIQILQGKKELNDYKEYLDVMVEELDRANSIITEFLAMGKQKAKDVRLQNINSIISTIVPLIQADAIVKNKYVEVELQEVPDLLLDSKEIRQLLLNLCRNGLEAMSQQGSCLTIRTYTEDDYVVLAIKDEGEGIEPDILEKIGTPFFTTKENGTGLGLGVCYSIAARHQATIDINTGVGGTTFLVKFKDFL